jgi:hypothetical protein
MTVGSLVKPGVEVEQVITPTSPTVISPTLVPVVVGPCFAIMEPFSSDGSLDSDAEVSIAASLRSTSVLGALVGAASTVLGVSVDGGDIQVISLPAVAVGSNLQTSAIPAAIQKKLTGVLCKLDGNKIVITSKTAGANSSLKIWAKQTLIDAGVPGVTVDTTMANSALAFTTHEDVTYSGQGPYRNQKYEVPYENLPVLSFHPGTDELVFSEDEIDLYRTFLGSTYKLSKTSAVNWTSYLTSSTKLNNHALAHGAPFTAVRQSLYALSTVGSKTNKVMNLGRDASVRIPLSNDISGVTNYPDASEDFYISAEAKGAQDYLGDNSKNVGPFVGTLGNALNIKFVQADQAAPTVVWDGTSKVTITYCDSNVGNVNPPTTYTELNAQILADTDLPIQFQSFLLVYPADKGAVAIDGATATLHNLTWYLSGGQDPVNFGANPLAGIDDGVIVLGSVKTDTASADPCSLVTGKNLYISINGAPVETITIPAAKADLLTALTALTGITATEENWFSEYAADTGKTFQIELDATGDFKGHAATLEISGDAGVMETLFAGYTTKTEALVDGSGAGPVVLDANPGPGAGTRYNLLSATALQKALKPGSITVDFGSTLLVAHVVSETPNPVGIAATQMTLSHSGFHPLAGNMGDAFQIEFDATGTLANTVSEIQTALSAAGDGTGFGATPAADQFLDAAVIKLDNSAGTDYLVIYDKDATAGNVIQFVSATNAFETAFSGTLDFFGKPLTTTLGNIKVTDYSSDAALPMRAVPSVAFPAPAGWSILNKTAATSLVDYGTGQIEVNFDSKFVFATAWTQTATYTRGAASFSTRTKRNYAGIIWTGRSTKVSSNDRLWDNGSVVGTIVKTDNLALNGAPASPWGDGAVLVLNNEALDKGTYKSSWYISAENLPESGGRSIPELICDDASKLCTVRHALNRGPNGIPLTGSSTISAKFRALRLDVTAEANNPGLSTFADTEELAAKLGPIDPTNPLALGIFCAMLNAGNAEVSAMGVSATTVNEPEGTVKAYKEAAEELEKYEAYAIAILTQSKSVHQIFDAHASTMSEAANKKERVVIINDDLPSEKVATLVMSGAGVTAADQGGNKWHFDFGESVNFVGFLDGQKDANGNEIVASVGSNFTPAQGIYLEREGDAYRYLVIKLVSASVVEVDIAPAFDEDQGAGTSGNGDAFYHTSSDDLDEFDVSGEKGSIFVRQAAIDLSATAGKNTAMSTLYEIAGGVSGFKSRRTLYVQPDATAMLIDGVEFVLPGYYYCAAIAGMTAGYTPAKPFTNVPILGFTRVINSSDRFSDRQIGVAAAGGVWWVIQDTPGTSVYTRQQLTTDMTNKKTQEYSIVKAIDFCAKQLRNAVGRFIGSRNIDPGLLNEIGLVVQANLNRLAGKVVQQATLGALEVVPDSLDEIALDVNFEPFYPNNKIRIKIFV